MYLAAHTYSGVPGTQHSSDRSGHGKALGAHHTMHTMYTVRTSEHGVHMVLGAAGIEERLDAITQAGNPMDVGLCAP